MSCRFSRLGVFAFLLVCLLQGCAAKQPNIIHDPTTSSETATDSSQLPSAAQEPTEAISEPTGVLALPVALAAVLARNPELEAFSWDLRAADARVVQASLRPNPDLSVDSENFVGSGAFSKRAQYQSTLQLSQLIELGGKRERRTEAAARARDQSAVEYEARRVEVLGATTVNFIEVVSEQERLRLTRLAVTQAEESLNAVVKRVRAGVGSGLEENRARAFLARTRVAEKQAAHRLLVAKQNLAARWGGSVPHYTRVVGDLFEARALPPFQALEARLESAPERRLAVAEERVREAEAALARTKQTSDVVFVAGWRNGRDLGDQAAVAGLSVPLQVFNRYQGDIAAAESAERGARARTAGVEARLRAVIFGLYHEILRARAEMEAMRTEIIPRSEEALALARKGFSEGLFSQLDLLDAQRTINDVRQEYLQAATTFHRLVAEAERLLGEAL